MATHRLTRPEQAAANRKRVLDAANDVFRAKGYHAATLDEIAEAAGFSKGVVYSQFGSKDDLFLALLERRIDERSRQNLETARGAPPNAPFRDLWTLGEQVRRADEDWFLALIEFRVHAARNPELNQRYAELHARTIAGIAATLEFVATRSGRQLPAPADLLARLSMAVSSGYTLEYLVAAEGAMSELGQVFARFMNAGVREDHAAEKEMPDR